MMYRKLALLAASCLLSVSAFATTYDDAVDATFKNDADALAPLLAKGLDPNTVTSSGAGEPLLMLAIRKNANSVIDLLLKQKNIKVDQPNTLKETPLMIAIFLKDNDVAKKLIAHGAAVNNPKNWSPLHYAATSGNKEMVKYLISKGADVNARTLAASLRFTWQPEKPMLTQSSSFCMPEPARITVPTMNSLRTILPNSAAIRLKCRIF